VQTRDDDDRIRTLAESLNDEPTMLAVRAERAFLQALEGGCQVPIGALAVPDGDGALLHGMIADVDGARVVRGTIAWTSPSRS
jgi:hydroxymethylbilane synthase